MQEDADSTPAGSRKPERDGYDRGEVRRWLDYMFTVDFILSNTDLEGAQHKSFDSRDAAQAWIDRIDAARAEAETLRRKGLTVIYTDGSADDDAYSYGAIVLMPDGTEQLLSGKGSDPEALRSRNIAGELAAVMQAIAFCRRKGLSKLVIFHGYQGCSSWVTGAWDPALPIAARYADYVLSSRMQIEFRKVSGHSGNSLNELADRAARMALGKR